MVSLEIGFENSIYRRQRLKCELLIWNTMFHISNVNQFRKHHDNQSVTNRTCISS